MARGRARGRGRGRGSAPRGRGRNAAQPQNVAPPVVLDYISDDEDSIDSLIGEENDSDESLTDMEYQPNLAAMWLNTAKKKQNKSVAEVEEVPEERFFLNPENVSVHLFCSICQEVYNEPYRAPCGHSYCKKCIFSWLKTSKTCPEDRKSLNEKLLHHDFIVENIIGDYTVACPWRPLGCDFIGPLHQLKIHKGKCSLNPTLMPKVLRDYSKDILEKTSQDMMDRALKAVQNQSLQPTLKKPSTVPSNNSGNAENVPSEGPCTSSSITGSVLLDRLLLENDECGVDVTDGATNEVIIPLVNDTNAGASITEPVLVAETDTATANVSNQGSGSLASTSSALSLDATSAPSEPITVEANDEEDAEESNLPPAQVPSLRMRLYLEGNNESRDLLCNFLESSSLQQVNGLRVPAAKRPRLT